MHMHYGILVSEYQLLRYMGIHKLTSKYQIRFPMLEFALALVPRHIGLMPGVRMKLYIVEVFNQVLAVNRKDHRRWVLAMRSNRDLPGGVCQVNGTEEGVELLQWMPGDLDPEFEEGQGEGGEGGSTMSRGEEDRGEDVDAMDEDRSKVVNAMHDMTISDEEEEEREKTEEEREEAIWEIVRRELSQHDGGQLISPALKPIRPGMFPKHIY